MSIKLTKDITGTPDVYSDGDGLDPVSVTINLDGTNSPPTEVGIPVTDTFVWADDDTTDIDNYSSISVAISGSDTGITWEMSPNGTDSWASSINLSPMDVSVTHATIQVWARATALNDGSVATANYITADIEITATENPA